MVDETSTVSVRMATTSPLGRISLAGFTLDSTGVPERPMRTLGSYGLVYVVDGGGRYRDATGLDRPLRPGDLILLFPDLRHLYGPVAGRRFTELWLLFDGPVFDLWRATGLLDPARPLRHLEPVDHWRTRFESVLGAPRQPGHAPPLLEVCRLQTVLGEALLGGAGRPDAEAAWVARACALLEADVGRDVDLRALADDLGMSYDGFRKRFARTVGVSPARWRAARAVDRAAELMQQGNLSDRQIAAALGFCDPYHFSRRFKQLAGRTPRQFRAGLPRGR